MAFTGELADVLDTGMAYWREMILAAGHGETGQDSGAPAAAW
jgi:hypothetical protein